MTKWDVPEVGPLDPLAFLPASCQPLRVFDIGTDFPGYRNRTMIVGYQSSIVASWLYNHVVNIAMTCSA